ncbi:hypothetical protein Tco_0373463 [Tanacetum coccineum]
MNNVHVARPPPLSASISQDIPVDNSRQSSSRFRQVQSTELQKHGDEREQIRQTADRAAADSDRCIAQNYKNTEMNKSRSGRQQTEQQQIQADSRFRQTAAKQQIQTTDPDSGRQSRRMHADGTIPTISRQPEPFDTETNPIPIKPGANTKYRYQY